MREGRAGGGGIGGNGEEGKVGRYAEKDITRVYIMYMLTILVKTQPVMSEYD